VPYTIAYKEADGGVITTYSDKVSNEEFHRCLKEKFLLVEKNMLDEKMVLDYWG
jgi:hypothetical protein